MLAALTACWPRAAGVGLAGGGGTGGVAFFGGGTFVGCRGNTGSATLPDCDAVDGSTGMGGGNGLEGFTEPFQAGFGGDLGGDARPPVGADAALESAVAPIVDAAASVP